VEFISWKFILWAAALGGLSAVSLPLGASAALRTNPKPQTISLLAAFGAGALIAALSVELVAPTVFALHEGTGGAHPGEPFARFLALLSGAVLGGMLFVLLDALLNAHGGFLRKTITSIAYFGIRERDRQKKLVHKLSQWPLFQKVSAEHVNALVAMVRPITFNDGEIIARQGEQVGSVLFLMAGGVRLTRDGSPVGEFGPDNILGILPVLAQAASPATATAKGQVTAFALAKENFDHLRRLSPEFDRACQDLTRERLEVISRFETARTELAVHWAREAEQALRTGTQLPTAVQLRQAREEHGGAPLAIWIGNLIDGIPGSFVIGSGLWVTLQVKAEHLGALRFREVIPFTLVAGLFLSNFPEALSSSANMKLQGWSKRSIFLMWLALMVIAAVGAGFGYVLAGQLNPTWLVFAEGLSAGAMLTMIAAAMIPEAVHLGNASGVGLGTLAGFLAAIAFSLFE
jgi:CRP-like cAMP-binding protein